MDKPKKVSQAARFGLFTALWWGRWWKVPCVAFGVLSVLALVMAVYGVLTNHSVDFWTTVVTDLWVIVFIVIACISSVAVWAILAGKRAEKRMTYSELAQWLVVEDIRLAKRLIRLTGNEIFSRRLSREVEEWRRNHPA